MAQTTNHKLYFCIFFVFASTGIMQPILNECPQMLAQERGHGECICTGGLFNSLCALLLQQWRAMAMHLEATNIPQPFLQMDMAVLSWHKSTWSTFDVNFTFVTFSPVRRKWACLWPSIIYGDNDNVQGASGAKMWKFSAHVLVYGILDVSQLFSERERFLNFRSALVKVA